MTLSAGGAHTYFRYISEEPGLPAGSAKSPEMEKGLGKG